MRWSETVTLEFVKIYLKHECLWNPSNPDYKLKHQREKAYIEISSEFKDATKRILTVPEIRIKIKNLRTTYVQQVHKILQKSSPDCIYEPSLIWFHEMDRCLKHVPSVRNTYNAVSDTHEVDSSGQVWIDFELQNEFENKPDPDPIQQSDEESISKQEETLATIKEEIQSPLPPKKFKKKKIKHRHHEQNPLSMQEDEFDVFGKFIAMQLRQMNLDKALRVQLNIQTIVSKARMTDDID